MPDITIECAFIGTNAIAFDDDGGGKIKLGFPQSEEKKVMQLLSMREPGTTIMVTFKSNVPAIFGRHDDD